MAEQSWWVHDLNPIAVRLWGDFGIRWYGIAYVLGFIIGAWLLWLYYKKGKSPLNPSQLSDAMLALIIGIVVGGRVGYIVIYNLQGFLDDPLTLFRVWEGGMASHGGFVGVAVACWWISRKFKISFLRLGDLLCTAVPPGLMLGRLANFINGELWGNVSTVPWAIIFPKSAPPGTPIDQIQPRHPSQLYEAALEGLLLLVYTQIRLWFTNVQDRPGRLAGEFFILYAIGRTVGELFRYPDQPQMFGINQGIIYSVFILAAGLYLVGRDIVVNRKTKAEA